MNAPGTGRRESRRRLLAPTVLSAVVLLPLLLHNRGDLELEALDRLEGFAYDLRLGLTMPGTVDDRIVIVDVDERSLADEGQWPWPRDRLALLVERLFDHYGVQVVGFDMVFAEPDRSTGLETLEGLAGGPLRHDDDFLAELARLRPALARDRLFAERLHGGPAVLGFAFQRLDHCEEVPSVGVLPRPLIANAPGPAAHIPLFEPCRYTGNLSALQAAARGGGFFDNPAVDPDGVYRRVPLLQRYRGAVYESFALAMARAALEYPPLEFEFFSGMGGPRDGLDLEWVRLGELRLPVDQRAGVLVPYRGPEGSFPYVSATDVLTAVAPRYPLQGAIALVGASAAGLRDLRVTPVGESYNGVEVHANIIAGILDERIKHHPRFVQGIEFSLLLLVALLMTWIMTRAPLLTASLATALLMLSLIAFNLELWRRADFLIPVASTLALAFMLYFVHLFLGYLGEARGRHMLSMLFGQYVPPELVEEMARNPMTFDMEIASREMTVMFADVRGFTSIAEELEPRELSRLMNDFLTPMTRVIHRNRGTIDKYMGDAIMAFWGAPLEDPEHARNALLAGLEMLGALRALEPMFERRGWPVLTIGIGINTGVMRVGNMGSEFRQAYTVMGDAVNLAARLQSLTRPYGAHMAVGESTVSAAPDFAFLELDRVQVKGKSAPVGIFEPVAPRSELGAESWALLERHRRALSAYRNGDWDRAEQEFFTLLQTQPRRKLFGLYLDRITRHRSAPPVEDWGGIRTHLTK